MGGNMVSRYVGCVAGKNTASSLFVNIKDFFRYSFFHIIRIGKHSQQSKDMCFVQFLGLKDKNGKIIHFGDILIDSQNNLLTPVCEVENGEHKLFFKPIKHLDKNIGIGCKSTYSNTLEILGNVNTEIELLKIIHNENKSMQITYRFN